MQRTRGTSLLARALAAALLVSSPLLAPDAEAKPPKAKPSKRPVKKPKTAQAKKKKREPPPPPPPLDGATLDFDDGQGKNGLWSGRAFVHRLAAGTGTAGTGTTGTDAPSGPPADKPAPKPLPLLVFLHGTNEAKIPYRWMGGGQEGDVRRIASEIMESGQASPFVVVAPSSVSPLMGNAMTSWIGFDLDAFLDKAFQRLGDTVPIDKTKIVLAAHSGAGCGTRGGIVPALKSKVPIYAAFSIDTCMGTEVAVALAAAGPTHVVVSYQTLSWDSRPFSDFKTIFLREVKRHPAPQGVLRELVQEAPVPMAHDAMVPITLKKWMPKILPPPPPVVREEKNKAAPGTPRLREALP